MFPSTISACRRAARISCVPIADNCASVFHGVSYSTLPFMTDGERKGFVGRKAGNVKKIREQMSLIVMTDEFVFLLHSYQSICPIVIIRLRRINCMRLDQSFTCSFRIISVDVNAQPVPCARLDNYARKIILFTKANMATRRAHSTWKFTSVRYMNLNINRRRKLLLNSLGLRILFLQLLQAAAHSISPFLSN